MTGSYRIRITPRALADLTAVFDFIRKDSPQNAKGMIRIILDAIDSLEQFPQRFPVAPLQSAKSRNIRSMVVYPYIVRTASTNHERVFMSCAFVTALVKNVDALN